MNPGTRSLLLAAALLVLPSCKTKPPQPDSTLVLRKNQAVEALLKRGREWCEVQEFVVYDNRDTVYETRTAEDWYKSLLPRLPRSFLESFERHGTVFCIDDRLKNRGAWETLPAALMHVEGNRLVIAFQPNLDERMAHSLLIDVAVRLEKGPAYVPGTYAGFYIGGGNGPDHTEWATEDRARFLKNRPALNEPRLASPEP